MRQTWRKNSLFQNTSCDMRISRPGKEKAGADAPTFSFTLLHEKDLLQ